MTKKRCGLTCDNLETLVYLHEVWPKTREWEARKKLRVFSCFIKLILRVLHSAFPSPSPSPDHPPTFPLPRSGSDSHCLYPSGLANVFIFFIQTPKSRRAGQMPQPDESPVGVHGHDMWVWVCVCARVPACRRRPDRALCRAEHSPCCAELTRCVRALDTSRPRAPGALWNSATTPVTRRGQASLGARSTDFTFAPADARVLLPACARSPCPLLARPCSKLIPGSMQASSYGAHALVALPCGAVWRQAAEEPGEFCAQPRLPAAASGRTRPPCCGARHMGAPRADA
jgi:hypothetical protein